jgi:beta-glucosidase
VDRTDQTHAGLSSPLNDARATPDAGGEQHAWPSPGDLLRRADDLLALLTTDEKVAMLHQHSPGVPRLGIAPFHTGAEALHGAAWNGVATVFPQAVGLGATWDPDLVAAVGAAVGEEVRALHRRDPAVSLNVWAPVVNPLRDPRWGRNEEGYSEDPLLTARMAVAYCQGLRGEHPVYWRTAPLLKHFLAYNNETNRDTTSSVVRPRVLHEYELPPFRAPIESGVAVGVMPAYNLVNGRPNHVSPLINKTVRAWTDEALIVCSDAHAPSNLVDTEHYFADHAASHAAALRAGVDSYTDHGPLSSVTTGRFTEALRRGLITVDDVDRAVRRLLLLRLRLGEFDPELDPYAAIPETALDSAAHRGLARQAARRAIVLLRNDGLLPLTARGLRLAVVGPLADTLYEDWYSGTMPYRITVADGLREALGDAGGAVTAVEEGIDRVALRAVRSSPRSPESSPGPGCHPGVRQATGAARPPATDAPPLPEPEGGELDLGEFDVFDWGSGTAGDQVVTLRSVANGRYLTVTSGGAVAAEAERPNGWVVHETFVVEPAPVQGQRGGPPPASSGPAPLGVPAPAGPPGPDRLVVLRSAATARYVTIDESGALTASADAAGAQALRWRVVRDGTAAAARAAAGADACVVVVGNDPLINGRETQDRTTLALPPAQERLVRAALRGNPRAVLVVMSSYPYAVGWADAHVPAIVWTCHGGQETGRGMADVLLGAGAPSGRLPQTWYASDDDLPGLLEYDIIAAGRTYLYFAGRPLYPFGHGLSYTRFAYSGLRLDNAGASGPDEDAATTGGAVTADVSSTVTVTVDVTNTGGRDGTTVVQVYTRAIAPRRRRPLRALAGFARVTLAPGETRSVPVPVAVASLGYWDVAAHRMTVDPGVYEIMVGSSSADIAAAARLRVPGPEPGPRPVLGAEVAAADFDEYHNVTLVDATRQDGDAVAPAGPGLGWVVFRDTDLSFLGAPGPVTLRVAREERGLARAELRLGHPVGGELLAEFTVPSTGDRYAWAEVTAPLSAVTALSAAAQEAVRGGVGDLCLVLDGAQRVASLRVGGGGR